MSDKAYEKLRNFLDQYPLGYPATESGVEMDILRTLFTPDEAQLAVQLTPIPESQASIAQRVGQDEEALSTTLETMAGKGLIFRSRRDGQVLYNAAGFMIGLYEYSVGRLDKDLARLYWQYYEEAYQEEMGASNVPGFKVIPISENIKEDISLIPYQRIEEEIGQARKISVAPCVCRKESELMGHGCQHLSETCLSFGVAAEYYIDNGTGREITSEEALDILKKADDDGLVHAGVNAKHLSNICNCCPCCCDSLKGIVSKGHDKAKYMNALYYAQVDEDKCSACGLCEERCPIQVISVDDAAAVDHEQCLGCGLCASACPEEAIDIRLREDRYEPHDRVLSLGLAILEGKEKHVGLSDNQKVTLSLLKGR